jgi:hypothetical protein
MKSIVNSAIVVKYMPKYCGGPPKTVPKANYSTMITMNCPMSHAPRLSFEVFTCKESRLWLQDTGMPTIILFF